VLLAAGLLVALSLFSYDPADLPGAVHPHHGRPANLLGTPGAWLAQGLIDALGAAVYLLLATWFVLVVLLFLRRSWLTWILRLAGWLLLLPCAAVAADWLGPEWSAGSLAGGGGSLGACLACWLESDFEPAGRALIFGGCLLLGLVLTVDFALVGLVRIAWRAGGAPGAGRVGLARAAACPTVFPGGRGAPAP
jgi:hypothetical protein